MNDLSSPLFGLLHCLGEERRGVGNDCQLSDTDQIDLPSLSQGQSNASGTRPMLSMNSMCLPFANSSVRFVV